MKGKIFYEQEEQLKRKFELEYKKLLKGATCDSFHNSYRVLTSRSYTVHDFEITIEEFNKTLLACLGFAIRSVPEIKKFNPTFILNIETFEVKIKYER